MTQDYLNTEIQLSRKIFMYYTDKMYDQLSIGNSNYKVWYRDGLQLYYLVSFLEDVILDSGVPYLGAYELTENALNVVFDKVREYYLVEIDEDGEYLDMDSYTAVKPTYLPPYQSKWNESTYSVAINDLTNFVLPFTYSNIDPKSLIVTIEGYGPIRGTEIEEAYSISDGRLYWHHYFNLKAGMKVHFQYLQTLGL